MLRPCLLLLLFTFHISFLLNFTNGQSDSPKNIETFYPFSATPQKPSSPNANTPLISPPPQQLQPTKPSSSSNSKIAKAVAATAASTLVLSGLIFLLIKRGIYGRRRRDHVGGNSSREGGGGGGSVVVPHNHSDQFVRYDGNLKGFIVDENGLDVLYWKNLEGKNSKKGPFKEVLHKNLKIEEKDHVDIDRGKKHKPGQEIPLLRGKSSTSHIPEVNDFNSIQSSQSDVIELKTTPKPELEPPPPSPPPTPPNPQHFRQIADKKSPAPPPPPPASKTSRALPPPLPTRAASLNPIPKAPQRLQGTKLKEASTGEGSSDKGNSQVKLRPLHWDTVNKNTDHSMVWDKIDGGSFRFDGDLMEALFGYVATNKKSPKGNNNTTNPRESNSGPSAKTFILDTRKSQNIAVVLKSLSISRQEILDALMDGQGLDADTLEKLTKMTPTEEEKSQILVYDGNPTRLADAECFLYHILKAVPSAFARIDAMLFKFNYDSEISHLKESIQTLALACKELRTRGLFTKLLEAILKAGNHMNAGTSRGNAQAFDLTSLRKLSDVKSTNGKTTLLNFVLEEVVRSEGKRCVLNRSSALSRNSSQSNSTSNFNSENMTSKEEKEKEYITLGLPVVGGLSSEFSNVKKAATIDYDNYTRTCSALTKHVTDIKQLVTHCVNDGGQRFAREMKRFLEVAETELEVLREEQDKAMELVKRTTEYYQAKASKDKRAYPFQLFVIVRDFLIMVDQECVEVARKVQKKRGIARLGSSSHNSTSNRVTLRFPKLPEHFMSDKSNSSTSESDKD